MTLPTEPLPEWLSRAPLPLGVIRDGNIIFANDALLTLLQREKSEVENQPLVAHVAPEDRPRIAERHARRVRGEVVPANYEFSVVRKDGQRRQVEIWISSTTAGETFFQLYDRTNRHDRNAKFRALVRLGAAVQAQLSEEGIFAELARGLDELEVGWARLEPTGDAFLILDVGAPGDTIPTFTAFAGGSPRGMVGPTLLQYAVAWRDGAVFLDDAGLTASGFFDPAIAPAIRELVRNSGISRAMIARIEIAGAPRQLLILMADWLAEDDLPAIRLFAAQVSAALDAARVVGDLSKRNEFLDVLNRIAQRAGSEEDMGHLFASGSAEVVRVLHADALALYLLEGETAVLAHSVGAPPDFAALLGRVPLAGSNLGIVVRDGAPRVWLRNDYPPERWPMLDRLGQRVLLSVPLAARGKVLGVINVVFLHERVVDATEIELVQAAGAHFAAAVHAKRLLDDLRASYESLAQTQEKLVQRERFAALGELAAVVAHEVRNPLGVIFNAVGGIRRALGSDDRARTLVGILEEEAQRLNHIVGDLLDFARPLKPSLRTEPLLPVVREVVQTATESSAEPICVEWNVDEPLPGVPMDVRLMRQALLNVAINAVQAMHTGGTMSLRLRREEAMLLLEIADTGPGIPKDMEARIFEPFFTTRPTGTGLGLTVVKRIIDVHGGTLAVSAKPGAGAVFRICLPLERAEPVAPLKA